MQLKGNAVLQQLLLSKLAIKLLHLYYTTRSSPRKLISYI